MSNIVVTETRADGIFYRYELPETAELGYRKNTVETDANGHRRVVDTHDALVIEWPIDDGYTIETNDPELIQENPS